MRTRLFAAFREASGRAQVELELPHDATVADAVGALQTMFPKLEQAVRQAMLAVNHEYVGPDLRLRDGDELALIPPVSGGQGCR